jgi:O-antigen ligase
MAVGGLVLIVVLAMPFVGTVLERSHGTASRLDEWRVATRVISNHPLLGVGPEGYRIAVSEGVDVEYERAYPRDNVLPDRAHSSLLDAALVGGVPAAVGYAALLVVIGRRALRRLAGASIASIALTAALVAYFSAQLLLFPVFELDPIAWLLAGVLIAGFAPPLPRRQLVVHLKTVLAATVALFTATVGVLDVAANRLAREALTASVASDDDVAGEYASRAARLRPDSIAYRMIATQVLLAADTVTATDSAITHASDALDWSPNDPIAGDLWASSLLQRALETGDELDGRSALAAWQKLVERDPNRTRWQLQLGKAAALVGEVEIARAAWEHAAVLGSAQAEILLEELP